MYNIVTIERRYASGGNEIGKRLADELGYKLYDRNILIKAAKNLEIPYFQIENLDESTSGGILMNLAKTGLGGLSGNRELPLEAENALKRHDKRRGGFYSSVTNWEWGAPEYYDLYLNAGNLGIDACVRILAEAVTGS